jgi:thioredoxin 1
MFKGKNTIQTILALIVTGMLLLLLFNKNKLNDFISGEIQKQALSEYHFSKDALIDSLYNYTKKGQDYAFTLLEFGSGTCAICKQMEPVLEEFRKLDKPKVNVVFLNIMQPENLPQMKFFGISAVPLQIVLNKEGKEIFRHYGYISASDLLSKFKPEV